MSLNFKNYLKINIYPPNQKQTLYSQPWHTVLEDIPPLERGVAEIGGPGIGIEKGLRKGGGPNVALVWQLHF